MRTRAYKSSDEPILKAAYLERGFAGGWRPMEDAIAGIVVVNDEDRPVAMVAAHRIAEMRAVVDTSWGTPAWRQQALAEAHDAVLSELKSKGYNRFSALLEGTLGLSFGRRLRSMRGWFLSRGAAFEKEV